jgi:hypothetical protein
MPLRSGSSPKTRSTNIAGLLRSFKKMGRIGNSEPSSMKKAVKQAVAIAYSKARETIAGRA